MATPQTVAKEEDSTEDTATDAVSVAEDFWNDFEDSADDSPESISTPPSVEDINAAIEVLASVHGRPVAGEMRRPVAGEMIGQHFGVSARSGRRYLSMATA